jgi:hypothetical protein
MRSISAAALIWALGASAAELPAADPSLLLPYSSELEASTPVRAPSVAVFRRAGKELRYIGSDHAAGLDSPNLKTVRKVIEDFSPQVILLEGLVEREIPARDYLTGSCEREKFVHCGEPFYAAYLARGRGILLSGGEPAPARIRDAVVRDGISARDLLFFYAVRWIPTWRSERRLDKEHLDARIQEAMIKDAAGLGVSPVPGFAEFKAWYDAHAPGGRPLVDFAYNDYAPVAGDGAAYFQKISARVNRAREENIVEQIGALVHKYDRVLVIFGHSHLLIERRALERMLGKPVEKKLF